MQKTARIKELVALLNQYAHAYYNEGAPTVSDAAYDRLFDELAALEKETGLVLSNSPTQTVGHTVVGDLAKAEHDIPLLSLDKTKSVKDVIEFIGAREALFMMKLDGLTVELIYEDGKLLCASTRGDGYVGDDITHNAVNFKNIPLTIPHAGRLVVTGEAIIKKADFERYVASIPEEKDRPKHSRNLASGSIRRLDTAKSAERNIYFYAFSILKGDGFATNSKKLNLELLESIGFETCEFLDVSSPIGDDAAPMAESDADALIQNLRRIAEENGVPIDGVVITYDDVEYSASLGATGRHYRDGIAYKFEDGMVETVLRDVEWKPSRFGELSPVAIFDTVVIDGCDVSRATLHNLNCIKELELNLGNRILVSKRNMIIPHVEDNMDRGDGVMAFPETCPCCGGETAIRKGSGGSDSLVLMCPNTNGRCTAQQIQKLVHFVSKKALNIEGLSEATLTKFFDLGLVMSVSDIFRLHEKKDAIIALDGFGEKSYQRLIEAIEKSRNTTFERFLIAMDIPLIGRNASKLLKPLARGSATHFARLVASGYNFTKIDGFGEVLNKNIYDWFAVEDNMCLWHEMNAYVLCVEDTAADSATINAKSAADNPFTGKTVVATGKLQHFSRDEINRKLESLGAKAGSSVSKKTDYVIVGEDAGSKRDKAEALGVTIITEDEFFKIVGAL